MSEAASCALQFLPEQYREQVAQYPKKAQQVSHLQKRFGKWQNVSCPGCCFPFQQQTFKCCATSRLSSFFIQNAQGLLLILCSLVHFGGKAIDGTAVLCFVSFVFPRKHLEKNPPRDPLNYILSSVRGSLDSHLGQRECLTLNCPHGLRSALGSYWGSISPKAFIMTTSSSSSRNEIAPWSSASKL